MALAAYPLVFGVPGFINSAVWAIIVGGYRLLLTPASRFERLAIDVVFGIACFLTVFEGGWYLLPAVVLFALGDSRPSEGVTERAASLK